jgi:hypothetical protein
MKQKIYNTLFVGINKGNDTEWHRFPYSSDEKADAAFDSWIAKAKEKLGDRITTFEDLTDEYQKEAFIVLDGNVHIDVCVQDMEWDTLTTVPLDLEMGELEKKNQEWIDSQIKKAIKDIADDFYINPLEEVYKSDLLDGVKDCAYGVYGIFSEEVSEFSKNHSIVAIYCNYLMDSGEITDWEWADQNHTCAKLVTE